MSRRISLLALTALFVTALVAAHAVADDDAGIHRTGLHRARTYTRWALGESPSPLLASLEGDCGERVGGAFFIAPPIAENLELVCRVPQGLAIVFSHAAWFTSIPVDGSTDAEIIAAAEAGFAPVTSWVRFGGDRIGVRARTFNAGAFTVQSEPGSFYDVIGAGTGPIRTSITGTFLTIPPGLCGRHVMRSAVDFGLPGQVFSGTYRIRVRCDDD